MKYNPRVANSRCKRRKAHFTVPTSVRHGLMSAPLSGDLHSKYNIWSMPVHKEDKVHVIHGIYKGHQGKVVITKLWLDKDRKSLLDRKAKDQNLATTHQGWSLSFLFFQFREFGEFSQIYIYLGIQLFDSMWI
ncbi:hypothetical protein UlMin_040713 [Ulmus minor]